MWKNISYQFVGGALRDEVGGLRAPSWQYYRRLRFLKRFTQARRKDGGFLVAVVDGQPAPVLEGWLDTRLHRFSEIALRFDDDHGGYIWVATTDQDESSLFPRSLGENGLIRTWSQTLNRSSLTVEGRSVTVLHKPEVAVPTSELQLVEFDALTYTKADRP